MLGKQSDDHSFFSLANSIEAVLGENVLSPRHMLCAISHSINVFGQFVVKTQLMIATVAHWGQSIHDGRKVRLRWTIANDAKGVNSMWTSTLKIRAQ